MMLQRYIFYHTTVKLSVLLQNTIHVIAIPTKNVLLRPILIL